MKPQKTLSMQHTAATAVCNHCRRELSVDSFYVNKKTLCIDKYCKECRKEMSRRQYCNNKKLDDTIFSRPAHYLVITEVQDHDLRVRLILDALEKVRISIEQKQAKLRKLEEGRLFPETLKKKKNSSND